MATAAREKIIIQHAGKIPSTEIAEIVGLSHGGLAAYCSRKKISLRVPGYQSQRIREGIARKRAEPEPMRIDINKLWKPTSVGSEAMV